MTPEETIEGIADYVRASVEAIDADLSKRLSAIDMEDMEAAHETADDMLADALERLGFSESAKQYKQMCERFYYS